MSCIKILQQDVMYKDITTGCRIKILQQDAMLKILQQDVMYKDITAECHV